MKSFQQIRIICNVCLIILVHIPVPAALHDQPKQRRIRRIQRQHRNAQLSVHILPDLNVAVPGQILHIALRISCFL